MPDSDLKFELHRSMNRSQPYYWRIVVRSNGAVLASSETYVNKSDAEHAINLVYRMAGSATYQDLT